MPLNNVGMYEYLFNLGNLFLMYYYGDKMGLLIGGEIGCIVSTLIAHLIEFNFQFNLSRCSSRVLLSISVDLVQYLWYLLIVRSFMNILDACYHLVGGKRRIIVHGEVKKTHIDTATLILSFLLLGYAFNNSENKGYFALFTSKRDRIRDVLSVPQWLRDIEKDVCSAVAAARSQGCTFSYSFKKWW